MRRVQLTYCYVDDLEPLLALPRLRQLDLSWHADFTIDRWDKFKRRNTHVIATLRKRGVTLECTWPDRR